MTAINPEGERPRADESESEASPAFDTSVDVRHTADETDGRTTRSPDELPSSLGRYQVRGLLGHGAMGVVYRAHDPLSDREVAVKTMHGMSPEGIYRLKREFRSLARFEHPNVISLYELIYDGGVLFFSMELLEGLDFVTGLCGPKKARGTHDPARDMDRVVRAFEQLARGVRAIHAAGLLHRDLKPSNVMITPEGRVVILDFGLVHQAQIDRSALTHSGVVMGTPLYMSPEQAAGTGVSTASDWYGVGELLYEVLTGEPPFRGRAMLALLAAKQEEIPPPPSATVPDIPPELDALCIDLLALDPVERPEADEVLRRLGSVDVHEEPAVASTPSFLGRQGELAALHRAFEQSTSGRPTVMVVEGPSGIGKTALLEHFCDEVVRTGRAIVFAGRCSEREAIPYKGLDSVMDALSLHLRSLEDAADVWSLLPRDPRALARLFPVLSTVPAVASAPRRGDDRADPSEARRRAFSALAELWARMGDRGPLIVWIDDLQWSDEDSLALLEGVLEDSSAPSILLVCSLRSVPPGSTPVARFLQRVPDCIGPARVHRLQLGPMNEGDATRLAEDLLGPPARIDPELAREVAREAEGSPFFVGELVRYIQRTGLDASKASTTDSDSGVSLDNVIRHRLRGLPEDAQRLLLLLALAGGRLSAGVALDVIGRAHASFDAIHRLRSEHLIRPHSASRRDTLEIYHDRIRETALREIDSSELPAMHLELGRALSASGNADEVALSHHFRQAGEDQLATLHTLAAANQAAEALAFGRAAQLYRAVLELDTLGPLERAQTQARRAEALANAGNLHEAAHAYLEAAGGIELEDPRSIEWTRLAAEHLLASGYPREGRTVLRDTLLRVGLDLPRSDTRAILSLLSERARLGLRGLKYELVDAQSIDPAELQRLDVCFTASRGLIYTDGLYGANFHARHLRLALRCGEPVRIARALALEAHLMVVVGGDPKLERGQALLKEAAAIAQKTQSRYAEGIVLECSGHAWMAVGRWQQAFDELERASEIFGDHCSNVGQEIAYCRAHAAICLLMMGKIRELTPRALQLLREAKERANAYVEGFARGLLGNAVLLAPDRVDEAAEQLKIYRAEAPARFNTHMLNYVCQTAALERYRGNDAEAWAQCERDWPHVVSLDLLRCPHPQAEMWLWRGQCALAGAAAGTRRRELLREAEVAARNLKTHCSGFGRGYGALIRAGIAKLAKEDDAAVGALREAIGEFGRHEMESFEAAARRRLAELVGGDEGRELETAVEQYMKREGVVRPDKFVKMVAPGF